MDTWYETKQPESIAGIVVCVVLLVASLSARFYAQHSIKHLWELDNILIMVASVFCLATIVTCLVAIRFGLGLHVPRVIAEDTNRPANLIRLELTGYIITVIQCPGLALIKFSILAFYRRIFTSNRARQRIFTYALWTIGGFVLLLGFSTLIESIFYCMPIHYFWEVPAEVYLLSGKPDHPVTTGWCIPDKTGYGIPLIAGLISDLIILGLPAVGLWNLQLRMAQKVGIFVSLSLGVFACIIEAVRIVFVFQITDEEDLTWTNSDAMIWTAVETTIAITCANIPAAAPLLKAARESQKGSRWFRHDFWFGYASSKLSSLRARLRRTRYDSSDEECDSSTGFVMAQTDRKLFPGDEIGGSQSQASGVIV